MPSFSTTSQQRFLTKTPHGLPNAGEHWVGVKHLGAGSFGQTGLWVRQNSRGHITDRMAVKERPETNGERYFEWANHWVGREPREAYVQRILTFRRGRRGQALGYLVLYRGARRFEREGALMGRTRIYMEYCPFGSLDDLVKRYVDTGIRRNSRTRSRRAVAPVKIPEPAIWFFLLCLAKACVEMEGPDGEMRSTSRPHWTQVVHQDIKPANIFLAEPGSDLPLWPVAKLGDFGGARHTGPNDPANPGEFEDDDMTPGFMAPEQEPLSTWDDEDEDLDRPILRLAWTNIYGVGMSIRALMKGERYPAQRDFTDEDERDVDMDGEATLYSADLRGVVSKCLNFKAEDRWSPQKLVEEIQGPANHIARFGRVHGMNRLDVNLVDTYGVGLNLHRKKARDEYSFRKELPKYGEDG